MRIFLDQDVPHAIRRYLKTQNPENEIVTAFHQRWEEKENGELLKAVDGAGFDVMITADKDYLAYENKTLDCKLALIVLGAGNWPIIQKYLPEIAAQIEAVQQGKISLIEMPLPPKPSYKG